MEITHNLSDKCIIAGKVIATLLPGLGTIESVLFPDEYYSPGAFVADKWYKRISAHNLIAGDVMQALAFIGAYVFVASGNLQVVQVMPLVYAGGTIPKMLANAM